MTAATYTPYYLSIQYSRTDDSASNSSSTRINKLLSMFAFLKSSPNISTDSFNKHIINKTPSNNSISLNPIKNAPPPPPPICRCFENLNSRESVWSLDVKTNS